MAPDFDHDGKSAETDGCPEGQGDFRAVVLNLGLIEPQGFAESLSGVRQGSRHTHYSPVHTTLSVTQNKFSPLVLVVTSSLAAADHATLLGFDICAAGNLVVDLWLLWLYVICDFLLIFQSLHTNYVEQKKKVVGRIQYGFTCIKEQRKYVLKKSYFIFPITKGSVNALMKLAGFSTSNKV